MESIECHLFAFANSILVSTFVSFFCSLFLSFSPLPLALFIWSTNWKWLQSSAAAPAPVACNVCHRIQLRCDMCDLFYKLNFIKREIVQEISRSDKSISSVCTLHRHSQNLMSNVRQQTVTVANRILWEFAFFRWVRHRFRIAHSHFQYPPFRWNWHKPNHPPITDRVRVCTCCVAKRFIAIEKNLFFLSISFRNNKNIYWISSTSIKQYRAMKESRTELASSQIHPRIIHAHTMHK